MPNRLKELREQAGLTLEELGALVNSSSQQMSKLEKGQRKLSQDWLERLSFALNCSIPDILGSNQAQVPILGYVGAGHKVYGHDDMPMVRGLSEAGRKKSHPTFLGYENDAVEVIDCPSHMNPKFTIALRVKGDSMYPMARDGWLVFYERIDGRPIENYFNTPCVVQVKDGPILLKELRKSQHIGRFDLISHNAPPIENVELEWIGLVREIRPQ